MQKWTNLDKIRLLKGENREPASSLFDLLMHRVTIAVRTKLFQFQAIRGVPTIFHRGVPGDAGRPFIWIRAALGTFQRNYEPNAFILSHNSTDSPT
jgi:hypothetical protein